MREFVRFIVHFFWQLDQRKQAGVLMLILVCILSINMPQPAWPVMIALTLLSAWLLLIKPRKRPG